MKDSLGEVLSLLDSKSVEKTTHASVAEHPGHEVENFTQLTDAIAKLNFYNQSLNLFFRGQTENYGRDGNTGQKKKTVLLPSVFRKPCSPDKKASKRRLKHTLPAMTRELMRELRTLPSFKGKKQRIHMKGMWHFQETQWAILQHYDCPTPLLDVTTSLRVACTFATTETETNKPSEDIVRGIREKHDGRLH